MYQIPSVITDLKKKKSIRGGAIKTICSDNYNIEYLWFIIDSYQKWIFVLLSLYDNNNEY